jgi:uncharacterized heparinase superfamily protein
MTKTPPTNTTTAVKRAARAIAFARHMPLAKLARRMELTVKRAAADRWPHLTAPQECVALPAKLDLPRALFPPRPTSLDLHQNQRTFTFLNRAYTMPPGAMNWSAPDPTTPDCKKHTAHQLWRMNLHYMEYLELASDSEWASLVSDWIAHHSHSQPGRWRDSWNSYAVSLRTVVWMQQLAARRNELPAEVVASAEASLAHQLRFLRANLETDLGGNHLIKNIKALLWGSAYFSGREPERWKAHALGLLHHELNHQILPDGVHDERSAAYHAQVFADLLECRHLLSTEPICASLDPTLDRMAQALADLTHPDGAIAQFNDAGLNMAYAPAICLDAYARVTGKRVQARAMFAYPAAGYYGLRAPQAYLVVDCGRIGPDDLPAHGHADVLSFELSVAGERLIVDQGVFEYIAGDRRHASRSARNHNTLCIEHADQADFFGAFRCGRRPNVTVRSYTSTVGGFALEGTHDGFTNLKGSPRHVRSFVATSACLVITDTIESQSRQSASISVLLHPAAHVETLESSVRITRGTATLDVTSDQPIAVEPAVWWPDMGFEQPTLRLRIALPPHVARVTTKLTWPTSSVADQGSAL